MARSEVGNVHPVFREFWHPVAWTDEVTADSLFATTLLEVPLVLWRDGDGTAVAMVDECPHRGAPLSMGHLEGCQVVCPFHGWRFAPTGDLTLIPSLGPDATLPSRGALVRPFGVTEVHDIVWVALDQPRLAVMEWADGPDPSLGGYRPTAHIDDVLAAYQTDNLLDASHFSVLHVSLSHRNRMLGEHETHTLDELTFTSTMRKLEHDSVTTEGWLHYRFAAPFTVHLRSEEPDGRLRNSFFQAIQPMDARRSRLFFQTRVPQTDPAELGPLFDYEQEVQLEDLWMNRAVRRTGLRFGNGELHVRTDRNGVLYRQIMQTLVHDHDHRAHECSAD